MIITQLETAPNANIFYHYSNNDSLCSYKKDRLINYLNSKYPKVEVNSEWVKITDWTERSAIVYFKGFEIMCDNAELSQKLNSDIEQFKEL